MQQVGARKHRCSFRARKRRTEEDLLSQKMLGKLVVTSLDQGEVATNGSLHFISIGCDIHTRS